MIHLLVCSFSVFHMICNPGQKKVNITKPYVNSIIAQWRMPLIKQYSFDFFLIFVYYFPLVLSIKWLLIQVSNIMCSKLQSNMVGNCDHKFYHLSNIKTLKPPILFYKKTGCLEYGRNECAFIYTHICVSPDPRVQFMWIKLQAELPLSPFQHNAFLS